ncbi:hypothetical protein CDD83_10156 [Cordyceps sp. RAO-2017]|nr:hypothetical protein CDD83_10156 [Cordyceps sp. RAO-2017]
MGASSPTASHAAIPTLAAAVRSHLVGACGFMAVSAPRTVLGTQQVVMAGTIPLLLRKHKTWRLAIDPSLAVDSKALGNNKLIRKKPTTRSPGPDATLGPGAPQLPSIH